MKLFILTILLAFPFLINAQAIRIPDPVFRQHLITLGLDENDNGKIEVSEVTEVKELRLNNLGIINLDGINSFVNLEVLNCPQNKIARLDASKLKKLKELYVWDNPLTELNVTGLRDLQLLYVHNNGGQYGLGSGFLRSLDVSTLKNLEHLECSKNRIGSLDVSGLDKLHTVKCGDNLLTSTVLNKAPNLKYVDLRKNLLEISVDIRGLINLEYFNAEDNKLIFLNLTGTVNLKELRW